MVKRLATLFLLSIALLSPAGVAWAAGDLTVEPHRTKLYEGEVLTLNVRGSMKIELNLGNLFDLDVSSLPSPDIEQLEEDFEILGRNQRYSIRTVNNEMIGEITWTYQLAPKSSGQLTIPALTFEDATSDPINITVVSGSAPNEETADVGAESRDSFVELSTDKDEVYVQEQLVLTIKLFFSGNLIRGELSEPEHPDAIIENLGKQREYSRFRDGVRFRVVERRYAIFPQKPGELSLDTIQFEGRARTPDGQLKFLRDSETLFDIPVKGVPSGFSGDTWLPAADMKLIESGLPEGEPLTTGQNLTRTVALKARGLPSETLPPPVDMNIPGIRAYPEKPERSTDSHLDGLVSELTQTTALVPVEPGNLVLPEIRIPWWDTEADEEKVAVIPARTLAVEEQPGRAALPTKTDPPRAAATPEGQDTSELEPDSYFWKGLSLFLAIAWLLTAGCWWWARRAPHADSRHSGPTATGDRALFNQLCKAAESGSADTLRLLPQWASRHFEEHQFDSVADVTVFLRDTRLNKEIEALQAHLFGKPDQHGRSWEGATLVAELKRLRHHRDYSPDEESLPPLYPEGLASRS
ncbi:BatD family protein [Marinobacter sp.]|uniref:BatD family protein n=1 Tax=Marinobacter sp. TaxID=50741 RepID=UPI0034A5005D